MATKDQKKADDMEVEVALSRTERFLEKNMNTIIYSVVGVVVVVLAVLGINKYLIEPKGEEAAKQIFTAQSYFERGMFKEAIDGDGNALGFLDIIDNYGSTKSGKLARYYVGISYLHLGEYEEAIKYLDKFKTDDLLLAPLAESAKGDAYVELGDYSKAISAYKAGISKNTNEFTSPLLQLKLGLAYEANGDKENALASFKVIKDKYPSSNEYPSAEKYMARLAQ